MIVLQMLDNGDKVQTLQVSELIKILEDMPKNLPVCFSVVMDNGTTGDPEPSNGVLPIIGASFSEAGGGDDEFDAVLLYVPSPVEFEYMKDSDDEYSVDDNDNDRVADFSNKSLADVSLALIEVGETINAISNRVAELSEEAELSKEEVEDDEETYNEDEETYDEDEGENNDDDSDDADSGGYGEDDNDESDDEGDDDDDDGDDADDD
jgi:hypothetical protein